MSEQLLPERLRRISRLPQGAPASRRRPWIGALAGWASLRAETLLEDIQLRVAARSTRRAARARARREVPGRPGPCRRHARSAAILLSLVALSTAPWVAVALDPERVGEWAGREAEAAVGSREPSEAFGSVSTVAAARGRAVLTKRGGAPQADGSRRPFAGGVVAAEPNEKPETVSATHKGPAARTLRASSPGSSMGRRASVRQSRSVITGARADAPRAVTRPEKRPTPPRTASPPVPAATAPEPPTASNASPPPATTSAPSPPPAPAAASSQNTSSPPPEPPAQPPPSPQSEPQKRPQRDTESDDHDDDDDDGDGDDRRRGGGDGDDRDDGRRGGGDDDDDDDDEDDGDRRRRGGDDD